VRNPVHHQRRYPGTRSRQRRKVQRVPRVPRKGKSCLAWVPYFVYEYVLSVEGKGRGHMLLQSLSLRAQRMRIHQALHQGRIGVLCIQKNID